MRLLLCTFNTMARANKRSMRCRTFYQAPHLEPLLASQTHALITRRSLVQIQPPQPIFGLRKLGSSVLGQSRIRFDKIVFSL